MKIEQNSHYSPITITLETEREAAAFRELLEDHCSVGLDDKSDIRKIYLYICNSFCDVPAGSDTLAPHLLGTWRDVL